MKTLVRKTPVYDDYYTGELKYLQSVMANHGYNISLEDANAIWRDYSAVQQAYLIGSCADFIQPNYDDAQIVEIMLSYSEIKGVEKC